MIQLCLPDWHIPAAEYCLSTVFQFTDIGCGSLVLLTLGCTSYIVK